MGEFPLEIVLALIGIAVPILAFLWEFVFAGRKRLGYRVQMDTPVTGEIESVFPGVLPQLRPAGSGESPPLKDLSVVLVRIENSGTTPLDTGDYLAPETNRVGLHLNFPQRRVIGMAVTELSDPGLADSLGRASGIAVREDTSGHIGVIDLPKVPLNRHDHYKILAILQRSDGAAGECPSPVLHGGVKGGSLTETRSRTGIPRMIWALIGFLVLVITVQVIVTAVEPDPVPRNCASGRLTIVGSTAFGPVIREAAERYAQRCTGAEFDVDFAGSENGLDRLAKDGVGNPAFISISDGPKGDGYPTFVPRSVALSLFTMIVHKDVGINSLTVPQIQDLYAGRITNWNQVNGPDQPVVLVNRNPGSGTRNTLEARLLGGPQQPVGHWSCYAIKGTSQTNCDAESTADMFDAVAELPGAIGYTEFAEAVKRDARTVAIDRVPPTREGAVNGGYPFWGVEYAYSNGDLPGDSLAASFLTYLTDEEGKDVLKAHGNEPCDDLRDRGLCAPNP